jgi:hypothetical protein
MLIEYRARGRHIEGAFVCPPSTPCLGILRLFSGEFTDAGLQLDKGNLLPGPLHFERVAS